MQEAYIIDAVRTPIGRLGGSLAAIRADDLAALAIKALLARHPTLPPALCEDVILGCANQAGEDNRNVARMALLLAGLPQEVPGETVNRLCASGMSAVVHAHRSICVGDGGCYIAGGVEQMTRAPWVISKTSTPFGRDAQMFDSSFGWRFINPMMQELYGTDSMGQTAEHLAEMYHISREDQDRWALGSQQKAARARAAGIFAEEIVPVSIPLGKGSSVLFAEDEFMRPDTSEAGLAKLRPAFQKDGTVTAGNASGLNDGAVALLLASGEVAEAQGLRPLARILASAVTGVAPRIMGIGPVTASHKALAKAGLTLDDMDIMEVNEAFAAQVLACTRAMHLADDDPRINPNGGAIALGHPLGMTGGRIIQTAMLELHRQQKRYALVTMCIGVGQGYALVLERMA